MQQLRSAVYFPHSVISVHVCYTRSLQTTARQDIFLSISRPHELTVHFLSRN